MSLPGGGKHLQLKVALTDTELLSVLRERAERISGISRKSGKLRAGTEEKSDVVAHFSTSLDTLTLTGLLNQRHPIHFRLKPQTKTYRNFLRFFLRELKALSLEASSQTPSISKSAERIKLPAVEGTGRPASEIVGQLTDYIESKLKELMLGAQANADDVSEIIDVFSDDLEPSLAGTRLAHIASSTQPARRDEGRNRSTARRLVLNRSLEPGEKKFRLVDEGESEPNLISGFLSLEIEEFTDAALPDPESLQPLPLSGYAEDLALLRSNTRYAERPTVAITDTGALVSVRITVPETLLSKTEFFVHWGSYGRGNPIWVDEEVSPREIETIGSGEVAIHKLLSPDRRGFFGAVVFAKLKAGEERVWLGAPVADDISFTVERLVTDGSIQARRQEMVTQIELRATILRALGSFESFVRVVHQLQRDTRIRSLGRVMYEATRYDAGFRQLLAEYYQRGVVELGKQQTGVKASRIRSMLAVLQNVGLGEIVFVAPEGPHAIAGGLAQVIVGMPATLARLGLATTVVTPLYEESQGNKHPSAEDLIKRGVEIDGELAEIRFVGEIKIPFGPTYLSGSENVKQPPRRIVAQVYLAERGRSRIFFLRHSKLADRLYAHVASDEQLRRAIFLSRGTLELVKDPKFGITPHIIVTNDWVSALIAPMLRVDDRYRDDFRFRGVETIHVLHNCGRDYQGRFFVNRYGEDLWPLIGLKGDHYFGMTDPQDRSYLNLTAGALFHAGKGILAVSRPYAQQLLTQEGGEGLDSLFRAKAEAMFGISNGIDINALRRMFWRLGEQARSQLGLKPLSPSLFRAKGLSKRLPLYKMATKRIVQRKYGLTESASLRLVSLVGRLAEQKGIQLLATPTAGSNVSLLERVLIEYPEVQFLIGGPPSPGDPAMDQLATVVRDLEERYPGRVRGVYSFVAHKDALEITLGSDLFLMPSRYEPGGITQLEALACGTPVVARKVGGIAATLIDYSLEPERGNGFLFLDFSSSALYEVLAQALCLFRDKKRRRWLVGQAALAENDWSHRAPKYVTVLQQVAGVLDRDAAYPHLNGRQHLLNSVRP